MVVSDPQVKCYECGKIGPASSFADNKHKCKRQKISIRQGLIEKIEENDPKILGELADLILMQRGAPKIKEVKFTTKELNKTIEKR